MSKKHNKTNKISKKDMIKRSHELRIENKMLLDALIDTYILIDYNKNKMKTNKIKKENYKDNIANLRSNLKEIQEAITTNTAIIVGIESTITS